MENTKEYNKRRKVVSLISLGIFVAFFVVVTVTLWKPITDTFAEPEKFREWLDSRGLMGRIAFIGMVTLQVIFALIPGEPLEIAAGYAFGTWEGLILCLIGMAIGTTIIFLFTKLLGIKIVEAFISREKIQSLRFIKNSRNLDLLVFIIYLIPGTPKDLFTYFIGLTPIKLGTFLLITSLARIPSIISSTIAGNALGVQKYRLAVIVFIITAAISLVGIIVYNRISKRHEIEEGKKAVCDEE